MTKSTTTTVKEGKAQFTHFIRVAEAGGRVVVTRNGKPVADIVPHEEPVFKGSRLEAIREFKEKNGWPKTPFSYVAPDFDDPLPEDFLITPLPDSADNGRPAKAIKRR